MKFVQCFLAFFFFFFFMAMQFVIVCEFSENLHAYIICFFVPLDIVKHYI